MKHVIYYFSGRGNTLKTALEVSRRLDHPVMAPIRKGSDCSAGKDADTIGIFTPVIDFGIPAFVLKFIDQLQVSDKQPYIYAVVTCGGLPGAAPEQIRKQLKKKGLTLSADFLLTFGINWSASAEWQRQIDRIAEIVKQKQRHPSVPTTKDKLLTLANPLAKRIIPSEDKKFSWNEKCTGCGTCIKLCPVNNIRLDQGRPVWLNSCEQCAACYNWCPSRAISGTNLAARNHFTNQYIKLEQMLMHP